MPYCPRCGVEIEERLESCPLCDTAIPKEVRSEQKVSAMFPEDVIEPKPMYKELTLKKKRILVTSLIIVLGLFPIAITAGIDLVSSGAITWSYYVIVPVIASALIIWFFIHFASKPIISVSVLLVLLICVQLLLGDRQDPLSFFSSIQMTYMLFASAAVEFFLLLITFRKPKPLEFVVLILLVSAVLLFGIDYISSGMIDWSLVCGAIIFPMAIYLEYLQLIRHKGLNIIGFGFLIIGILLVGIDLTPDMTISWSIITSVVFVPLSLMFYILHVALFNDTDWKKALHL